VEFSKKKFLLTDTVGFIDRLPLTLIEAFYSTLEETIYSDLILLVVDISEPVEIVKKKLAVCLETIERIGASDVPIITALNKIDLQSETETFQKLEYMKKEALNPVCISALYETNVDLLKQEIMKVLKNYVRASLTIPLKSETMSFISWLFKTADVQTLKYADNSAYIVFEAIPWFAEKIKKRVEEYDGKFEKM
jgi:GTP-binding protein HflX